MTTKFYSPSLHRTCFLVLGCLFVLNCLVIFVIWEKTLKRGSSSIKVPVDFGLCYKGLWPVEKAFALMWGFSQKCGNDFHIQHKAKSFDCWCGWLLLSDFRSLPTESWIIVCFPLDDLPSNAHWALFIHRPCTCSPARTSAWVRMMPSIHPVTTIKVTCSEEAVYWQGETYILFSFYLHYSLTAVKATDCKQTDKDTNTLDALHNI